VANEADHATEDEEAFVGVVAVFIDMKVCKHIGRGVPRTVWTFWFEWFGTYYLRLGPLKMVDSEGHLVLSPIGIWLGTLVDDPWPYAGCYLVGFRSDNFLLSIELIIRWA
jgi:hypothetical protein